MVWAWPLRRLTWAEASGAVGDLGTFVPLVVALSVHSGLDVGTTLLFTGLYNVATGLIFGLPMPVQPMKSIAAIALSAGSDPLTIPQIMTAGITVGAIVLLLGVTRLIHTANRIVPRAVVRGIQLGVGLGLAKKGFVMMVYEDAGASVLRPWGGLDGLWVATVSSAFLFVAIGSQLSSEKPAPLLRRESSANLFAGPRYSSNPPPPSPSPPLEGMPIGLVVVLAGLVLAALRQPSTLADLKFGPSPLKLVPMARGDWWTGFVRAGVPQLPLTTLNSVVAVCALSEELFPDKPASNTAVAISVGLMNLVGPWFGAMPMCHGAGGLAAQHIFGARSGTAVVLLGGVKIMLGLLFGSSLLHLLKSFPSTALGAMLVVSGTELAVACRKERWHKGTFLMLITAGAGMALSNTALGFAAGMASAALMEVSDAQWWRGAGRWLNNARAWVLGHRDHYDDNDNIEDDNNEATTIEDDSTQTSYDQTYEQLLDDRTASFFSDRGSVDLRSQIGNYASSLNVNA